MGVNFSNKYQQYLSALQAFEKSKGWSQKEKTFKTAHTLCAREDIVSIFSVLNGKKRLPSLKLRKIIQLLRSGASIRTAFAAACLLVLPSKLSARAFYPDRGESVKLSRLGGQAASNMISEIETRRILMQVPELLVPRLIEVGEQGDYRYLHESLIQGRRFTFWMDANRYCIDGLVQLGHLYKATQAAPQRLLDVYPADDLGENLASDFATAFAAAKAANPLVPTAFTHRDISAANVAVADGRIVFLDWEAACIGPLLRDPLFLIRRTKIGSAKIVKASVAALMPFYEDRQVMIHELTMVFAESIAFDPKRTAKLLDLWRVGLRAIKSA